MPSLQFRLVRFYYRLGRVFSPPPAQPDLAKDRKTLESLGQFFKSNYPITTQSLSADGVPAEWITPERSSQTPVILYLHGGSFAFGSINSHRSLAANIAGAAQGRALIIDYRLAPDYPFPAGLEDCLTAYRWLLKQDIPPNQIIIAGDSAGGGLTLSALIALRDHSEPLPCAGVCLSPATDLAFTGESVISKAKADLLISLPVERGYIKMYLGDNDPRLPLASPWYDILEGLPPMLIQVGSDEVLLSDATRTAEKIRLAGGVVQLEVWDEMQHVWQFAASFIPEGKQAVRKIGDFIRQAIAGKLPA